MCLCEWVFVPVRLLLHGIQSLTHTSFNISTWRFVTDFGGGIISRTSSKRYQRISSRLGHKNRLGRTRCIHLTWTCVSSVLHCKPQKVSRTKKTKATDCLTCFKLINLNVIFFRVSIRCYMYLLITVKFKCLVNSNICSCDTKFSFTSPKGLVYRI